MGSLLLNILGTSFSIKADEDDIYLKRLLSYYKEVTSKIEKSGTLQNQLQIAILAGIMLCDELHKEKAAHNALLNKISESGINKKSDEEITINDKENDEAERITLEMIDKIQKVLDA